MCRGLQWKRVILCTDSVSVFIYLLSRRVQKKRKIVKPKTGKGSWNTTFLLPSLMNTCIMFTCLERTQLSCPFFFFLISFFVNRKSIPAPYRVPSRARRLEICFQSLLCSVLCFKPSIPHLKMEGEGGWKQEKKKKKRPQQNNSPTKK